jgi:hypothetical protein
METLSIVWIILPKHVEVFSGQQLSATQIELCCLFDFRVGWRVGCGGKMERGK